MSQSKNRNIEVRKALLERAYLSGLTVNRKYCPRIEQVPNLLWLWKNGMLTMERRGPAKSKWSVLLPTEKGLEYLGKDRLAKAIQKHDEE